MAEGETELAVNEESLAGLFDDAVQPGQFGHKTGPGNDGVCMYTITAYTETHREKIVKKFESLKVEEASSLKSRLLGDGLASRAGVKMEDLVIPGREGYEECSLGVNTAESAVPRLEDQLRVPLPRGACEPPEEPLPSLLLLRL